MSTGALPEWVGARIAFWVSGLNAVRVLSIHSSLPKPDDPGTTAPQVRQVESLRRVGVQVDVLEVAGAPKIKYVQTRARLTAALRGVDLVHGHYGFCGWLARSQFRRPVVVSFMGDDLLGTPDANGRLRPFSRIVVASSKQLAKRVDAVIVKSPEMAGALAPLDVHVIPNGVDLDLFRPMDTLRARAQLGWPAGKRFVLFPGNPDNPRKGYALATRAADSASAALAEPIELVPLVGVEYDRVPLIMNACDAMLMTSFIEGSPNVVKEAIACNLPVVGVEVGDVAELLEDIGGSSTHPRDPHELGAALAKTLREPRRSGGPPSLRRKGLDLESVALRIRALYEELLTSAGRQE